MGGGGSSGGRRGGRGSIAVCCKAVILRAQCSLCCLGTPEVEELLSKCGTLQTAGQPQDPPAVVWAGALEEGEEAG